jgi:uncharacterized protein
MNCPVCAKSLESVESNGVTVDVCAAGCGGIWFDQFELRRFDGPEVPAPEVLLSIAKNPAIAVATAHKRPCPRCVEIRLKRRLFNPRSLVEIDECGGCGGIWLDAGELAKIREELRDKSSTKVTVDVRLLQYLAERTRE